MCDILPDYDQDGPIPGAWIRWYENNKMVTTRINGDFGCLSRAVSNLKAGKGSIEDLLRVVPPMDRDRMVEILHHIEE